MLSILGHSTVLAAALAMASPALATDQETPTPSASLVSSTTAPTNTTNLNAAPTPSTPAIAAPRALPAGTLVEIALTKPVGSKLSKRGDRFGIRLVDDLKLDGVVLLPAGAEGEGEVIHAAPGKMGGGPGELLLAARFIERDGLRVPLKAFKMGRSGRDNVDSAMVVAMVAGPFALFIQGGEVVIPAGTIANAKLAADLPLPTVNTQAKR
jgi:hypothetical protein